MRLLVVLFTLALSTTVLASPYQAPLSCPGLKEKPEPGWKKDNELLIVPLHEKARTGLLNEAAEEGLISAAGPRFTNPFYEVADDEAGPGPFKCAAIVARSAICLIRAVASKKASNVLKCDSRQDLCGCVSYLGRASKQVQIFVERFICSGSTAVHSAEDEIDSQYVEYLTLAPNSLALRAVRGDLYNFQIDQLKQLSGGADVCPLGFGSCGNDCSCCIGICIDAEDSECVGQCI